MVFEGLIRLRFRVWDYVKMPGDNGTNSLCLALEVGGDINCRELRSLSGDGHVRHCLPSACPFIWPLTDNFHF
jgi:hypothetical protein